MQTQPEPTPSSEFQDDLLPLFVGITGHRDLRDEDKKPLCDAVRREFRALRARYPHTPLIALSPLGEGADRLVARAAMEEGLRLIVPLPLPREIYEQSFEDDASRAEFASFIEQAEAVFTLPWIAGTGADKDKCGCVTDPTPEQIEGQYAAMGAYLARYSHVLLAMWDGDDLHEHERIGGTAHIVRLRLHGAPPPYGPVVSPLERAGYGAVHHILTPRKSRPLEQTVPDHFSCQIVPSPEEAEDFARIDVFNADVQRSRQLLSSQVEQNIGYLTVSSDKKSKLDVPENMRFPVAIYGWADTLSTVFSRQMTRATKRVFLLVFFAAFSFNLFHSLPHDAGHAEGGHAVAGTAAHGAASSDHRDTAASHGAATSAAHGDASSAHGDVSHGPSSAGTTSNTHASDAAAHGAASASSTAHGASPASGAQPSAATHGAVPVDPHDAASHGAAANDDAVGHSSGVPGALILLAGSASATPFSIATLWHLLPWFLWFYLILVGINILTHGRTEKQELQTKYQDYRALAEGLRVQIYWRMCGLREDVSDHYLGKQRGELNWIRHAIKSCNVLADARAKEPAPPLSTTLPVVVQLWARDQRNYYVRKAHKEHEELEKQEKLIGALVIGSVVLTLLLGLVLSLPSLFPVPFMEPLKHRIEEPYTHAILMICIVMLAVTAGLLHGYNALLARAEHTKRYGRMGTLFEHACTELDAQLKVGHSHKTSVLLHELGREALAENADWVLLHRERPLEVPHAG